MKVTRKNITPAIAEAMLDNLYERQRHVKPQVVNRYANDMAEGRWLASGDTFKISTDGKVLDGQHRLRAIVQSGVTLENAILVSDLDEAAFDVMDQGRPRSFADWLASNGVEQNNLLAASIYSVHRFRSTGRISAGGATKPSIFALIEMFENEKIGEWLELGSELGRTFSFPKPMLVSFLYLANLSEAGDVRDFATALLSGENLSAGHPALVARNELFARMRTATSKRKSNDHYMAVVIHCWNAFAEEREITKLRLPDAVDLLDPHGNIYGWQHANDEAQPE